MKTVRTIGLVIFGMLFLALANKERRLRNDFELLHEDVTRIDAEFAALQRSLGRRDEESIPAESNATPRRAGIESRGLNELPLRHARPLLRTNP